MRKLPASERVGVLAFMPLSMLMVVTYAMLTPLALFTLDTDSWETRTQEDPEESEPEPVRDQTTAEILITSAGEPAHAQVAARSHAQLPAA